MKNCLFAIIALASLFIQEGQTTISLAVGSSNSTEKIDPFLFTNENDFQARQDPQPSCNYFQELQDEQTYYIYNKNYPEWAPPDLRCRWSMEVPDSRRKIRINCTLEVQPSPNCQNDKLDISLSGNPNFSDKKRYCGEGTIDFTSNENKLQVKFETSSQTAGSRFLCEIEVASLPAPACVCGISGDEAKIVGGVQAKIPEFPWRVGLHTKKNGVFCGGTLIKNGLVLTAAHCIKKVDGQPIGVFIGDNIISRGNRVGFDLEIKRVHLHPAYNENTQESDIALIELRPPYGFQKNIQPVCLPWKFTNRTFEGDVATASGWGATSMRVSGTKVLRKVDLNVVGTRSCQDKYMGTKNVIIKKNMICAYKRGFSFQGPCQGDNGGSLDYKDPITGSNYAIGVLSKTTSCGMRSLPDVYTQVVNFLDWIQSFENVTGGAPFCRR